MMSLIKLFADPIYVAKFQKICGVEYERPVTCDQQTQTRGETSDSDSSSDREEQRSLKHPCVLEAEDAIAIDHSTVRERRFRNNKWAEYSEYNNNQDKDVNSNERNHIEKIDYKIVRGATDAYHIEPNSKAFRKDGIFECCPPIANGNASKQSDIDDGVSKTSDIVQAAPPAPTVCIKYKFLFYLAHLGAFLGNEEFYLTFYPFGDWNLDSSVIRKIALLWAVVMYLGQATKDYLCWPRPSWPPVVQLETQHSQEYSMPSTHAMAGTAIPFCLAFYAIERYQVPWPLAATLAFLWFAVTCWSRLYLGVHTILDLVVGFVYALLILFLFFGYVEEYDLYQQTHRFAVPVLLFTSLALCTVCYPSNCKDSSKSGAVQIVAAVTGVGIGSWMGYHLGYFSESAVSQPYSIPVPTLSLCGMALLRFAVGMLVLAILYVSTRWLSIRFYSYMYGLDAPDKTFPGVMIAYKFTTYTVVGIGISFFAPLTHLYLGIHRPALFYEVV